MIYLNLETTTHEQREIVKAQAEYIAFLEKESEKTAVFLNYHGWIYPEEDFKKGEALRAEIKRLAITDSPEKTEPTCKQPFQVPVCICGFDADGWRLIPRGAFIPMEYQIKGDREASSCNYPEDWTVGISGGETNNYKTLIFRTKTPLPDCPCLKKEAVSEIAESVISEKPKLDLSGEIAYLDNKDAIIHQGITRMIASALQKLQDHANGRDEK